MASAPRARHRGWDWQELSTVALREARRVLAPADAEDAAQEALLRAYRAQTRCQTPDAPHGWVRTIARREAYRMFAGNRPVPTGSIDDEIGVVEDSTESVADRLTAQGITRRVPHAERSLLVRRYVFEQTSTEIAAALSLPPATVRVRLHRAVKRLSAQVAG